MDALPRERLPHTREGVTRKLCLAGHEAYATVNAYQDGRVGEMFLTLVGESGTQAQIYANAALQAASIALQYGAPLRSFVEHWRGTHADVCGFTGDAEFPSATGMLDLLAQWLQREWPDQASGASLPPPEREDDDGQG